MYSLPSADFTVILPFSNTWLAASSPKTRFKVSNDLRSALHLCPTMILASSVARSGVKPEPLQSSAEHASTHVSNILYDAC